MDAVAYQMSFDKEQLALLCANYDRRIDSLGAENKRLKADNAKLLELCEDMLSCIEIRAAFGRPPTEEMYETFYKRARELGVTE